jgi:hypothetical protein
MDGHVTAAIECERTLYVHWYGLSFDVGLELLLDIRVKVKPS